MRFWQSKACRVASGLGVLVALVLASGVPSFRLPLGDLLGEAA